MTEDLVQRVDTMKREIDALQIAILSQKKPWYKEIPIIVSVAALLFSFGTTYVRTGEPNFKTYRTCGRS